MRTGGLQRKGEGKVAAYFLAGFLAAGSSGFALCGLPLPGTLRMASWGGFKISQAYIESGL
jgi:hypothetical protein